MLVGCLYFYGSCRDEQFKARILDCMEKHVDYLIAKIGNGEGQKSILDTSAAWGGLNSSTILEPVIELYKLTGKLCYLFDAECDKDESYSLLGAKDFRSAADLDENNHKSDSYEEDDKQYIKYSVYPYSRVSGR